MIKCFWNIQSCNGQKGKSWSLEFSYTTEESWWKLFPLKRLVVQDQVRFSSHFFFNLFSSWWFCVKVATHFLEWRARWTCYWVASSNHRPPCCFLSWWAAQPSKVPLLPHNQVLHGGTTSSRGQWRPGGGTTATTKTDREEGGAEEGKGGGAFPSDVKLVGGQVVHEWLNQEVGGEVEDQAEGDGDGESRQGLLEDGQQQQGQAQALRVTGQSHRWVSQTEVSWSDHYVFNEQFKM